MAWRAIAIALALMLAWPAGAQTQRRAVVLEIDGAIGPAIADYIADAIAEAGAQNAGVIVLRMDTPGGLASSMRKIVSAILASHVPVVSYVAPSGARAASAGTYIAYASAIAAMAPGTNIGAATPVQIGGGLLPGERKKEDEKKNGSAANEPGDAETRKLINDSVAYIRSLAELHNRNADWGEQAVRSAASLTASAALKLNVIDLIADDIPDLLHKIDGRTVTAGGKTVRLETAGLEVVTVKPDWRTDLMAIITNPNVAFLLMLAGIYGLIFEFMSPGSMLPGTVGGICLLLALYALNLLPINYAGAALVLLGIGLLVAEVHIGTFGVIGVGGVIAFAIGSFMMFHTGVPGFEVSLSVVIGATIATAVLFFLVIGMLLRSRKRPVVTGKEALLGAEGETVSWRQEEGSVRVLGEIWRARAAQPLAPGSRIKVVNRDGLVLIVEPA
ncbi:MAG TPA: nodulation protein NfeD [Pseudolabrys sp.]|nr:nodulation protein NfeD [Pseudolabrys sp.]